MPDQGFAGDLESLRLSAGLSLRTLGRSSGIPRSTLSDALSGRRAPRLDTVLAIVRACGADADPWRRRWAAMYRQGRLAAATAARKLPVPAQLPRDNAGFTGRDDELARLDQVSVTLVHGGPGVGKTALAVHWAHSVAAQYPDGSMFLNLRGHHPTLGAMTAVEALGRLLGTLDVPWTPLTQDPDEGASLWRTSLAGRRLLILLDDAVSAEQVRPLLPGAPGCTTVVTSRRYLADLVVHDGVDGIVLDVLSAESSVALLSQVAGPARVAAEPVAAMAVAAACGHLPLALRLAGAVLAAGPDRRFAELADELAAGDRLTALEGLARPSAVENAFDLSHRVLPEDARFLFRRLSLHPGADIGAEAAALLADLGPATASDLLGTLAEAHLVEPSRSGRYRLHDLLRDYAARLAADSDSEAERDAARQRLLDWYVDRALAVSSRLDKGRERLLVADDLRSTWQPTDDDAAAWLEIEHRNLLAVIEDDARRGTRRHAWILVDLIADVLSRRRDLSALLVATDAALAAAQRQGDHRAEGAMRLRRGWLRWRGGQAGGAAEDFAHALTLFRGAGIVRGEASALRGLSITHADAGRLGEARRDAEAALAIYRAENDRTGQAATLTNLAFVTDRAADFTAAAAYMEASLALHRHGGNRGYIALALANLAHVTLVRGDVPRAVALADEAVDIAREVGDASGETTGLVNGALAHEQAGALDEAHRRATAAVARAREMGYRLGEAIALDVLASICRRLGRADAPAHREHAMRLIRRTGDLGAEGEILLGAARDACQDAGASPLPPQAGFQAAHDIAQRALDAALAVDAPHVQAEALAVLAACRLGLGKVADALTEARRAVEMHVESGARLAEVAARCVLAHALVQDADPDRAERERRRARAVLDELGLPDAAPVRRLLDATTGFA